MDDQPLIPDYAGACTCNVLPPLLSGVGAAPPWYPPGAVGAAQVVLLVLDGLGWQQLQTRLDLAPALASLSGRAISTVAPSTTATALTSITTGVPPGEHGVMGYRIDLHGEVLNVLRWATPTGDARRRIPGDELQPVPPFLGGRPAVVTKADFEKSGFTQAHLRGGRMHPWRVPSTMVVEVRQLLASGEPFIYAYYDGIDKVAHEYGLGEHYDAELVATDRLVGDLCAALPPGAALVITADHGEIDVGDHVLPPAPEVLELVVGQSGEARFRWLHARDGRVEELAAVAKAAHGDKAWVGTRAQVLAEGWFGPRVGEHAAARLGDVFLAARGQWAFTDPVDTGPLHLVGRHGSLTADEMLVPLLVHRA